MYLRPDNDRQLYHHGRAPAGRSAGEGPTISVTAEDEGGGVVLTLDPHPAETFDDRDIDRTLSPDEARELAAMLVHHADEQDRKWSR